MKPITIDIDVTQLKKEWFKTTEKDGKKRIWCKLVAWPVRPGQSHFDNTHSVKQSIPSDLQQSVDPKTVPFCGNLKVPDEGGFQQPTQQRSAPAARTSPAPASNMDQDDDCPF